MTPVVLLGFFLLSLEPTLASAGKKKQPLEGLGCSATRHMNNSLLTSQTVRLIHSSNQMHFLEETKTSSSNGSLSCSSLNGLYMGGGGGGGKRSICKHMTHKETYDLLYKVCCCHPHWYL